MSRPAFIAGISMTALGKRPDDSVKTLTAEAVTAALKDAGASTGDIQAAWFSNTRQPMLEGQNTVRGQIALREACAGKGDALRRERAIKRLSKSAKEALILAVDGVSSA